MSKRHTRVQPEVIQSFIGLGASALIFGALGVVSAFSGRSPQDGTARLLEGLVVGLAGLAVVVLLLLIYRVIFLHRIRSRVSSRAATLILETLRNRSITRVVTARDGFPRTFPLPFLLALIADTDGIEVMGGILRPRPIWQTRWVDVSGVDVGSTFDRRQIYDCVNFGLVGDEKSALQFVITGRGFGGLQAIEGDELLVLVSRLESLRVESEKRS